MNSLVAVLAGHQRLSSDGYHHVAGGACADGVLQTDLQPDQTAQLSGLPAAGACGPFACRPCPRACRTNI